MTDNFPVWPKIPRLHAMAFRLTEKIDGTNARLYIRTTKDHGTAATTSDGERHLISGSRSRIISLSSDNFGFARWVEGNKDVIAQHLPVGDYYGEWWGFGIQRGYGMKRKVFSIFNFPGQDDGQGSNTKINDALWDINLRAVPTLGDKVEGNDLDTELWKLKAVMSPQTTHVDTIGSFAAPGYDKPEGIVMQELNSRFRYKWVWDK